jgi:hypothetical protein
MGQPTNPESTDPESTDPESTDPDHARRLEPAAAAQPGPAGAEDPEEPPGSDFDLVAAQLRADSSDADTFFRVLVTKLSDALGERVVLQRGGGVFRRERPVTGIDLDMTTAGSGVMLCAHRERGGMDCTVARKVRGIVLSTKQVSMAQWVEELVSALSEEARRSRQTWNELHGLLS